MIADASDSNFLTTRPGASLRALRKQNNWTLAEVSRRTGLTVPTLSKIENDRISLTYDKLSRISQALGLDFAQLFRLPHGQREAANPDAFGRRSIVRAREGRLIDTKNYGHLYLAADLLNKQFVPMVVECRARSLEEFGPLLRHEGDEFAFVLEGTLLIYTDVYAPALLEVGDAIYFDSRIGHAYLTGGPAACRVLAVSSRPESKVIPSDVPQVPREASVVDSSLVTEHGSSRKNPKTKRKAST
jgi:transcriptional regulator with XRE-family HTH domain